MDPGEFRFGQGRVTFWDLGDLDESVPLDAQLDVLKEDLAQIEYPRNLLVDVGWYPEASSDGQFTVSVIRDQDWASPIWQERGRSVDQLRVLLARASAIADHHASVASPPAPADGSERSFSIRGGAPSGTALASAEDASLDEAVETAFQMGEEDARLEWQGAVFSLNYKYDLGMMLDDLVTVLHEILARDEGQLTIGWASSGFPFSWTLRWSGDRLAATADARDERFRQAIAGRERVELTTDEFVRAWQPVLQVIADRLQSAGYTDAQLPRLPLLRALARRAR